MREKVRDNSRKFSRHFPQIYQLGQGYRLFVTSINVWESLARVPSTAKEYMILRDHVFSFRIEEGMGGSELSFQIKDKKTL